MIPLFRIFTIASVAVFFLPVSLLIGNETGAGTIESMHALSDSVSAMADTIASIAAPAGIKAEDSPNDAGQSITVSWQPVGDPEGWLSVTRYSGARIRIAVSAWRASLTKAGWNSGV